jgi:uncharacterized membrane protein
VLSFPAGVFGVLRNVGVSSLSGLILLLQDPIAALATALAICFAALVGALSAMNLPWHASSEHGKNPNVEPPKHRASHLDFPTLVFI